MGRLPDEAGVTSGRTSGTPCTVALRAMRQGLRATVGTDVSRVPSYPRPPRGAGLARVAAEMHALPPTA